MQTTKNLHSVSHQLQTLITQRIKPAEARSDTLVQGLILRNSGC